MHVPLNFKHPKLITNWLQFRLLRLSFPVESLEFLCGVLCDVFNEIVLLTASVVRCGILAVLGKPENSGESSDVKLWRHIVSSGVHLDDLHVLILHGLTQLVVDGSQLLAVAAPEMWKIV